MRFMKMKPLLTIGIIVNLMSSIGLASVSIKNGNFFVAFTDMRYPGGFETKIERVYNSKSGHYGYFGHGWGSEYEPRLGVSADASVVVHEYGGGSENRFIPGAFKPADLDNAVNAISDVAKKAGILTNATQIQEYRQKLKSSASFRNDQWERFRSQGKIAARKLAEGTQLQSNRFSFQYITKVKDGYVRTFDSGKVEKFDEAGRLVRIQDKNNNFVTFTYGKTGLPEKLLDNFNRKIIFKFNKFRLLEAIEGEGQKLAQYRYNNFGELTWSKDADGNTYTYKYDSEQRHNMTEIGYSDQSKMLMSYHSKKEFENIKSVKDRDGTLSEYSFMRDPKDRGHYWVNVSIKNPDDKTPSLSKYEYFLKSKPDGEEWTYKLVTTVDGDTSETFYNECCGLPIIIRRGIDETLFEYDSKGHVTKKITPTEVTELNYDPKNNKVTKVSKYPKTGEKTVVWSRFEYDDRGNLKFALNSDKRDVRLFYDKSGRIVSMVDQNRRRIEFKYNDFSKPVLITDPTIGSITVSYTNSGEIKKVDSPSGRKIAVQVTTVFQNLLDIIRPAGVSLSF